MNPKWPTGDVSLAHKSRFDFGPQEVSFLAVEPAPTRDVPIVIDGGSIDFDLRELHDRLHGKSK